jgi:diguanylate cyclase (GGDEF)-like protein
MRTLTGALRLWFGFFAATLILVAVGASVVFGARNLARDAAWVEQTHIVLENTAQLYSRVKDVEAAQRGYLLTGAPDYLGQFYSALAELRERRRNLQRSLAGSPEQLARAERLLALIDQRTEHAEHVLQIYTREGLDAARREIGTLVGKSLMDRIASLSQEIEQEERRLLEQRRQASDGSASLLQATTAAGIVVSVALLLLVFGLMLREVRIRQRAERRSLEAGEQLRSTVDELRTISSHTRELSRYAGMLQSCRSIEEAMDVSQQSLASLLPDVAGTVYLLRPSLNLVEARMQWGRSVVPGAAMLAPDDCWALRRGQSHAVRDVHHATICAHCELPAPDQAASTLCMPLAAQGETLGFLHLAGAGESAVRDVEVATTASEQLSLALSNLRLQESLRLQSIRDPLTGLYNRRYLMEALERELARCGRRQLPLTVMMLDVDHFKRFNDAHGHDGGDALLTSFARLLQAHCRGDDIACRFGGEEFTLIFPEMGASGAVEKAEAIRAATENLRVQHLREPLSPVTVSIGTAGFPADGTLADDLIRTADAALYRAKRDGRNRAVAA